MRPIRINRCICSRVLFSDLKAEAASHGVDTLEALQEIREFGVNCRLCHPYVRRMLQDGTTEFNEILRDDAVEGAKGGRSQRV